MVYAFIIQTLDSEEPELAYYRFYSTCISGICSKVDVSPSPNDTAVATYLYDTSIEKKELLYYIIKKVHMLYSLKLKQSLIPVQYQDKKTLIKGCFMERNWKPNVKFSVVWEGVPGVGFSIVCPETENLAHAQNVLDLIISELEKYLQLVSYPAMTTKSLDRVALIVDYFLPGGQILFLNSSMIKCFEKQLELDLQQ